MKKAKLYKLIEQNEYLHIATYAIEGNGFVYASTSFLGANPRFHLYEVSSRADSEFPFLGMQLMNRDSVRSHVDMLREAGYELVKDS